MARKLFQRIMPSRERLSGRQPAWTRRFTASPNAWHLNRRSVARGLAIGLFWAWVPIPLPSLWASCLAWRAKGNVPLAFACCWLRNPITTLPMMYLCLRLGQVATLQAEAYWPFFVGCGVLSIASGVVAYFGTLTLWRWNVARRWAVRGRASMPLVPATD